MDGYHKSASLAFGERNRKGEDESCKPLAGPGADVSAAKSEALQAHFTCELKDKWNAVWPYL